MPFVTPPLRRNDGVIDWAWGSVPHREEVVSGDALFVEEGRHDGRLLFLLIDVMDHGPKANAVVEMFRRFYLWDESVAGKGPGEILMALSSLIAPYFETLDDPYGIATERELVAVRKRFVAALAALVDPATSEVHLSLAHFPSPHRIADTGIEPLGQTGPWLGDSFLRDEFGPDPFAEVSARIGLGGCLVATTDGLTDARAPDGDRLPFRSAGLDSSLAALRSIPGGAARVARLLEDVRAHGGPDWPDDDTTAIAWTCVEPPAEPVADSSIPGAAGPDPSEFDKNCARS